MSSLGNRLFVGVMAGAMAVALNSCSANSTAPEGEGRVSILLTDAPGDLEHAWIQITGIYLQGWSDHHENDGDGDSHGHTGTNGPGAAGPEESSDGSRVWLLDEPTGWIDLLELSDATMELIKDVAVPAGHYSQLRFVLGDVVIVDTEAKVFATSTADLSELPGELTANGLAHCPSCDRSGLKVRLPGGGVVLGEETTIIVVDFDVSQTFGRERGNSNRWVMHPVLIATDFAVAGTIAGTVMEASDVTLPDCGSRSVTVQDFVPLASDSEGDKSGTVNSDAEFTISFLTPGNYTLGFLTPVEIDVDGTLWSVTFEASAEPEAVTVELGQVSTADYTITAASCSSE